MYTGLKVDALIWAKKHPQMASNVPEDLPANLMNQPAVSHAVLCTENVPEAARGNGGRICQIPKGVADEESSDIPGKARYIKDTTSRKWFNCGRLRRGRRAALSPST